jgi:ribose transport system substrate-binding protein
MSVILALGAAVACLPACGKKDTAGKIKIGIVTNCTAEFWSICEAGANKAVQDLAAREKDPIHVDLQFRQPEKDFDASVQMPIIESWVTQGMNGIAVSVIDPQGQTEDLTRIAKKLPLLTMDNDADKTGRLCYIGIDNYEAGKAVGRLVKESLPPSGGTVGVFIGSTKSANGKARTQGVLDELAGQKDAAGVDATHPAKPSLKGKKYGNYFLIDGEPKEDNSPNNAQPTASGVLGRVKGLPDLCMVGLYAYNPPAILEEAKALGMDKDIKIIGFDEAWVTLGAIGEGKIAATVVQDPFRYGYDSVMALAENAKGNKAKIEELKKNPIPYRVVNKTGKTKGDKEHEEIDTPGGKLKVDFLESAKFTEKLRADLASVKK